MLRSSHLLAALLLSISFAAVADSEEDAPSSTTKRLDVGLGIGTVIGPDYRGSKTYRGYVAPIPYVIYRGEIFRSDREGVRGEFLSSDQFEVNLSLAASVTPDSDENELREGMRGLDSTIEVGPAVNINLSGDNLRQGWMLTLPARAVVSLNQGSLKHIGWLAEPQAVYRSGGNGWDWTYRLGPVFATGHYHDYYYTVTPEQALPERPSYDAGGGYNGLNTQFAISRRAGDFWYAFFVRYYNLEGANFLDSPLVETKHGASGGLAISWVIY